MRSIFYYIIVASLFVTGCSKDATPSLPEQGDGIIHFTLGSIARGGVDLVNEWSGGEKLVIFTKSTDETPIYTPYYYTIDTDKTTLNCDTESPITYNAKKIPASYEAFYPAIVGYTTYEEYSASITALSASVDVMTSSAQSVTINSGVEPTTYSIEFLFNHIFASVEFTYSYSTALGGTEVIEASLVSTLDGDATAVPFVASSTTASENVMVNPSTDLSNLHIVVSITSEGVTKRYSTPLESLATTKLEAGNKYSYPVSISN